MALPYGGDQPAHIHFIKHACYILNEYLFKKTDVHFNYSQTLLPHTYNASFLGHWSAILQSLLLANTSP